MGGSDAAAEGKVDGHIQALQHSYMDVPHPCIRYANSYPNDQCGEDLQILFPQISFSQRARSGHAGLWEHFTWGVCFKQAVGAFTDKIAGGTYEIKVTEFNSDVKIDLGDRQQPQRPKKVPAVLIRGSENQSINVA